MMELAGWSLFACLIVCNWAMFIMIDGFFQGDVEGLEG
jgi:hypothetical protein